MGISRWLVLVGLAVKAILSSPIQSDWDGSSTTLSKRQFATFGPHVSMGQTNSEFIEMTTTFVPGHPPAKLEVGSLFVWPGLFDQQNRSEGDLIQTVAEAAVEKTMQLTCLAKPGQWCIRPFVVSRSHISQTPEHGKPIDGPDQIKINYKKAPGPEGLWTQTLWNLGKGTDPLFVWTKGTAACKWFELATESQLGAPGSADTQFYYNTTLTLKDPDPELDKRFTKTGQIEATNPRTSDGGRTWFIEKVVIPPMVPGQAHKPG